MVPPRPLAEIQLLADGIPHQLRRFALAQGLLRGAVADAREHQVGHDRAAVGDAQHLIDRCSELGLPHTPTLSRRRAAWEDPVAMSQADGTMTA